MTRREAKTVPVHELPTVLVIGCSRDFAERCREGAAKTGAIVRATEEAGASAMVSTCHPLALVLTWAAYERSQSTFDALAARSQSSLVRIQDETLDQQELEKLVISAVGEARQLRGQGV